MGEGEIRDEAEEEAECADGEADYGEELEVPSEGLVLGCGRLV